MDTPLSTPSITQSFFRTLRLAGSVENFEYFRADQTLPNLGKRMGSVLKEQRTETNKKGGGTPEPLAKPLGFARQLLDICYLLLG